MLEGIEKVRNPAERRGVIERALSGGYLLTDVLSLPMALSVEVQEIILGIVHDSGGRQMRSGFGRRDTIHIQTVDGKPLGRVKIGQQPHSITTTKLTEMELRGDSPDIFEEYGADFDLDPERAIMLLKHLGYGLNAQRFRRRLSAARGEQDSHGREVSPIDGWRIVERGSRFARKAADELVSRAAGTHPEFAPVDKTESRRLLARALELVPGHAGAQAALDAAKSEQKRERAA
jgi:hypothetical protein